MTVLPIVGRELRVASRRTATYVSRLSVALAGLLLGALLFTLPGPSARETGIILFTGVGIFAFVCCGFAGVLTTADCISTEKREGTLGLLFLTDLRSYDIVLGKLSASSLSVIYAVLALFPILAIPLLLGGVTITEFIRVVVVALNTLFFSLSLGVFVSSMSRDDRRAMVGVFLLVLFFAAGFPLLAVLMDELGFDTLEKWVLVPSSTYSCVMAFEATSRGVGGELFEASLITVHLMAWMFLALSMVIVRRTWQDKADTAGGSRKQQWQALARHGGPKRRLSYRRELLAENSYYWLLARNQIQMWSGWLPLVLAGVLWGWGLAVDPREWKDPSAYFITALLLHAIFKWWVATEAGRRLAQDRASGALELLLTTPLTVMQLCRGQFLALSRQFFGPLLVLLVIDFVFLMTDRTEGLWVGMFVAGMILLIADFFTLSRVGVWLGVCSRSATRASAAVIVRILVLPLVLYGLMWTGLILLLTMTHRPPGVIQSGSFAILSYLFFGLAVDAFFYVWATAKIENEFREAATTRFQRGLKAPKPSG